MYEHYERPLVIDVSHCDWTGKLSVPAAFDLFMDMAARHADAMGVGFKDLTPKHQFWLTVKTRITFYRRPKLLEECTISTEPIRPVAVRGLRDYAITKGDEVLVRGKTEWVVIDFSTNRLVPQKQVLKEGTEMKPESDDPVPFAKISPDFSDAQLLGTHTVQSTDIDVGHHMNNAKYLYALASMAGTQEREALEAKSPYVVEIVFRKPCLEGNELAFYERTLEPEAAPAAGADAAIAAADSKAEDKAERSDSIREIGIFNLSDEPGEDGKRAPSLLIKIY